MQDSLQLSLEKKRRIVENRRQLLLNLEQLLRKQNMVRQRPVQHKLAWHPASIWRCVEGCIMSFPAIPRRKERPSTSSFHLAHVGSM